MPTSDRTEKIRTLNDAFRREPAPPGMLMLTAGIEAGGPAFVADVIMAVQAFDDFNPDNDPYGEHDFGSIMIHGEQIFWKIDYYDHTLEEASIDEANPDLTRRVLTIMFADEY